MVKQQSPQPINSEINFEIEELFFSTTDDVGTILSGNEVFVRISQYAKEELIGEPHNIIRHPDMPKIVFKLLWDYIQAGNPIAAYVKNLAKDGRYYWVLAVVFPIPQGYLSIRIKPTTDVFKLMPTVYKALHAAEQAGGMDASLQKCLEIIQSKGFDNYDVFFLTALTQELIARDELIKKMEQSASHGLLDMQVDDTIAKSKSLTIGKNKNQGMDSPLYHVLENLEEHGEKVKFILDDLFKNVQFFVELDETLKKNYTFILKLSENIRLLAINASTESLHLGALGASLTVLAREVRRCSDEMKKFADQIVNVAKLLSKDSGKEMRTIVFQVAAPKLQIEMVNFFIKELKAESLSNNITKENVNVTIDNAMTLIDLLDSYLGKTVSGLRNLNGEFKDLCRCVESIDTIIRILKTTQSSGKIESARMGDNGKSFILLFEDVQRLSIDAQKELASFKDLLIHMLEVIKNILDKEKLLNNHLQEMKPQVSELYKHVGISTFDDEEEALIPEPMF